MPGFASVDQIINALSVNLKGQYPQWQKVSAASAVTAGVPISLWSGTGMPEAGATPVNGLAGAVACDRTTVGSLKGWINPTAPATLHLLGMSAVQTSGGGADLLIVDRLAHANINNVQATGNFAPALDATARLNAGEGAQLLLEVTTAFSAAANTRSFTYTNQDGTAGQVTPTISYVASRATWNVPWANYFYHPLAAGDVGVRSVQATTLVSGTATGAMNVVLVRPIARLPMGGVGLGVQRDYVIELPQLPRIRDNACLMFLVVPVTAATYAIAGEVVLAEN